MLRTVSRYFNSSTMSVLSPQVLLSTESRERFVNNVKQLPSFIGQGDENPKSYAAVLIPIVVVDDEVSLVFTKRSSKLNSHAGQMSFPGGKADPGESTIETALRETHEELHIPSSDVDIWTVMPKFIGMNKNLAIIPVVGVIKNFHFTKLKPNSGEVEQVYVVSIRSFIDKQNRGHVRYEKYQLPLYNCPETGVNRIWGISGLITNLFLMNFLPDDVYDGDFSNTTQYDRETLLKQAKL